MPTAAPDEGIFKFTALLRRIHERTVQRGMQNVRNLRSVHYTMAGTHALQSTEMCSH